MTPLNLHMITSRLETVENSVGVAMGSKLSETTAIHALAKDILIYST